MKTNLTGGVAQVGIKYDIKKVNIGRGKKKKEITKRTTELMITLPNGKTVATTIACASTDQFNKSFGRKRAILTIFKNDTSTAQDQAEKTAIKGGFGKVVEAGSLNNKAKDFYLISRPDRALLFKIVCPEFFRKDPVRVAVREKALLERLSAKYGTTKNVKVKQNIKTVKAGGGTVVGAKIGNIG